MLETKFLAHRNTLASHDMNIKKFFHFAIQDATADEKLSRQWQKIPSSLPTTEAAVLVLFTQINKQQHIVLTRRSQILSQHAGQIAFAGGRQETQDYNLSATALREAEEEIGLEKQQTNIYGCLKTIPTLSGYRITPVLAETQQTTWCANQEVEEIFTLPASLALDTQQYHQETRTKNEWQFTTIKLPYLHYDIWGATAAILYRLAISYQHFDKERTL